MSDERSANAVDKHIGERIRERRIELAMSQERLAELIGVTFQQIQKYERGINRVAASRLFAIAEALDAELSTFFEGLKGRERSHMNVAAALSTPGAGELLRFYAAVADQNVRMRILALVRVMSEGD